MTIGSAVPQSVLQLGSEWPRARTHLGEARWPLAPPSPLGPRPTPPAGPPQLADGGPRKKNTILLALTLSFNCEYARPKEYAPLGVRRLR